MNLKMNLWAQLTEVFSQRRLAEAQSDLAKERRRRRVAERNAHQAMKALDDMTACYRQEVDQHRETLRSVADAYARPVTGRYVFARTPEPAQPAESINMSGREFIQNRKQAAYHEFYEQYRKQQNGGK